MNDHKEIYEYEVDGKKRYGDPFVIDFQYRKTLADLGMSPEQVDKCHDILCDNNSQMLPWYEALGKLSPAICAAFGVKMHNTETNEGMTLCQLYNLLFDFFRWQNSVKKNTDESPNGSPSTDSLPSGQTEESLENTSSIGNSITEPASTTNDPAWQASPLYETGF